MDTTYLFDNAISDKRLKIMKTAIPYFNPGQQKMLSMYIIFKEMQNTIQLFNNPGIKNEFGICGIEKEKRTSGNMINDIKKVLDDKEKEKIDTILTVMNILNMFHTKNEFDPVDAMRTMLSPEQQDMFEMYAAMLNSEGQAT